MQISPILSGCHNNNALNLEGLRFCSLERHVKMKMVVVVFFLFSEGNIRGNFDVKGEKAFEAKKKTCARTKMHAVRYCGDDEDDWRSRTNGDVAFIRTRTSIWFSNTKSRPFSQACFADVVPKFTCY